MISSIFAKYARIGDFVTRFMASFGYVKITKEVVALSEINQAFLANLARRTQNQIIQRYSLGQKTLTNFLKSGELLNENVSQ